MTEPTSDLGFSRSPGARRLATLITHGCGLARVATVAALAFAAACNQTQGASSGAPAGATPKKAPSASATRVEVATLARGGVADRLVRPGEVIGSRDAHLAAPLGGYVEQVMVKSGQQLKKNQPIARVDARTHAAQMELAKVELEDAKREVARLELLEGAVTRARVDDARTRLARAEAQHRMAATQLSRATIRAPFAGVLVDLGIEQGEVAAPGQPIGHLVVLDPIRISVSVGDRDVASLAEGDQAIVTTTGSAQAREGRVARIEPAADLETRTFMVEVELANPERKLLPGMIAKVEFRRSAREESLLLPQEMLVTRLDGNGVFVVDGESVARWRPLKLGAVIGDQVEVLEGLARGDRIVNVGHRSLSDGDPVIISREGLCCRDGRVYYGADTAAPTHASRQSASGAGSASGAAAGPSAEPEAGEK